MRHGVTIIGYTDLASRLAKQSSTLYATNLLRLTEELCKAKDGVAVVNMEDDAIRGLTVVRTAAITWPAPAQAGTAAPARKGAAPVAERNLAMATARAHPCPKTLTIVLPWPCCSGPSAPMRPWLLGTSRCSCWPASSATWWCGTSRRRCTRR